MTVEDIAGEEHEVQVAPGRWEKRPCLVVRLQHPKGRPVWVQMDGHHGGQEHHFYAQSGRSTALFWNVPEVKSRPFRLCLTSLESFKKSTVPAVFSDLPGPQFTDQGPGKVRLPGEGP